MPSRRALLLTACLLAPSSLPPRTVLADEAAVTPARLRDADLAAALAALSEVGAGELRIEGSRETRDALRRGERSKSSVKTWTFIDGPFVWSPDGARELWVLAGEVPDGVLVAVFEPGGDRKPTLVARLMIRERGTSVALGYSASQPRELLWTTCYGCPGEGGSIVLSDDGRPKLTFR